MIDALTLRRRMGIDGYRHAKGHATPQYFTGSEPSRVRSIEGIIFFIMQHLYSYPLVDLASFYFQCAVRINVFLNISTQFSLLTALFSGFCHLQGGVSAPELS